MQVDRVRRLAGPLYIATIVVMAFVVIGTIAGLILTFPTAETLQQKFPAFAVTPDIPNHLIWLSMLAGLLSLAVWVWPLDQMRRLFGCYKSGAVLTDQSAGFIQRIGVGFMGVALIEMILIPVQSVILTWANPAGERAISVGLNSDMLGFLIAAGLMTVIGWAMREAASAAAENKAFV